MNEARRQAARPGDFGGGPDGGRKLPNEVKAMARQMGISAKELSEVGDTMWSRLTELMVSRYRWRACDLRLSDN